MNDLHQRDLSEGKQDVARLDIDCSNLFLSEMLLIFKNVNTVFIKTTESNGLYSYSLSMICLLSLIEPRSLNKVIVKANSFYEDDNSDDDDDNSDWIYKYNWIKELWSSDEKRLKKCYEKNGYDIMVKIENEGNKRKEEYWFVINKKPV
eukprot:160747_1